VSTMSMMTTYPTKGVMTGFHQKFAAWNGYRLLIAFLCLLAVAIVYFAGALTGRLPDSIAGFMVAPFAIPWITFFIILMKSDALEAMKPAGRVSLLVLCAMVLTALWWVVAFSIVWGVINPWASGVRVGRS
jgi:hypothetical protein